jgi:hypothetical protein
MKEITEKSARRWMRQHAGEVRDYRSYPGKRKAGGQWQRQYLRCLRALGDVRFRVFAR